jgi:hypothetical protein
MCHPLSLLTLLTPLTPTKFRRQSHYMGTQKGFDHRIGHLFSRTAPEPAWLNTIQS